MGRTAGHRPGACALNEKRPGRGRALTLTGHPSVAVASGWEQEGSAPPSLHSNGPHCCPGVFPEGEASEEHRETRKYRETNLENIPKCGDVQTQGGGLQEQRYRGSKTYLHYKE